MQLRLKYNYSLLRTFRLMKHDTPINLQHTFSLSFLITFILICSCLTANAQAPSTQKDEAAQIFGGKPADPSKKQIATPTISATTSPVSSDNKPVSFSDLATPTAQQSPQESPSQHSLGILDLEEHIANSRFTAKPGLAERGMLVRVYERIALASCFPPIPSLLKGITLEADTRCKETLQKLSNLHSNNAILICAQKGVDSVDCIRSYESQHVRKFKPGEAERLNLTSKPRNPLDSPEVKARFTTLQKKLLDQIAVYKKQFSIANLKELDSSLFSVLILICSDDALELTLEKAIKEIPASGSSMKDVLSLTKEIESLGQTEQPSKPSAAATIANKESETNFFRSRILSTQCYDTIIDALNIDFRLSSAVCFRDGFIAPSCLSALRRIQTLKEPPKEGSTPTPKAQTDGLATF